MTAVQRVGAQVDGGIGAVKALRGDLRERERLHAEGIELPGEALAVRDELHDFTLSDVDVLGRVAHGNLAFRQCAIGGSAKRVCDLSDGSIFTGTCKA